MEMMHYQLSNSSYQDSLKVLDADIQHANDLAAAIPRGKDGARLQMKLVYNRWAPLLFFLLQRIDCSCVCLLPRYLNFFHVLLYKVYSDGRPSLSKHGRKATIREFYGVISPSLQRLHGNLEELEDVKGENSGTESLCKKVEGDNKLVNIDLEREDECGICLEPCTKMVLPNCCHAMNTRSESCPFCRGSLKRVNSEDLWVLTCNNEVVDTKAISKEDLSRFYLYVDSLPKDYHDSLFLIWRPSTTMALLTNTLANIYSLTNHISWANSTFMGGKLTGLYLNDSCQFLQVPAKSPSGDKFCTRTFARRKSVKKWRRDEQSQNGMALERTEKGLEEERVLLSDNSSLEDDSAESVQTTVSNIASRSDVLQACTVTSGLIAALGVSCGINGRTANPRLLYRIGIEMWHLELITGLVILVSSCRYLLLKTWPDFAESSEAANQQVLTSLQPLDYVVVSFLPGGY
uniref:RING-type domain-containing protein n=1 Tax=Salix viminalis TaxID=40686 RepID=A0A6N2N1R7_SALVM